MMPARSTLLPTMKPGTSWKNTSGRPKASHSMMKRAALSAESTSRAPPSTIGWLATIPTGAPPSRRPVGVVRWEVGEVVLDRADAGTIVLDLEVAAAGDLAVDLRAPQNN